MTTDVSCGSDGIGLACDDEVVHCVRGSADFGCGVGVDSLCVASYGVVAVVSVVGPDFVDLVGCVYLATVALSFDPSAVDMLGSPLLSPS